MEKVSCFFSKMSSEKIYRIGRHSSAVVYDATDGEKDHLVVYIWISHSTITHYYAGKKEHPIMPELSLGGTI